MKNKFYLLGPTLAILLVALAPGRAEALSCAAPPSATAVYPRSGAVVPVNAVILISLRNRLTPTKGLLLFRGGGKILVKTTVRRKPKSHLVRLIPIRPMRPNTVYTVSLGRLKVVTFRTVPRRTPAVVPKLASAHVRFSKPSRSPWFQGRRSAWLKVAAAKGKTPVALEVRFHFKSRPIKSGPKRSYRTGRAFPFAADLRVAAANYCTGLPGAPKKGTYTLTIIPWSAAGQSGRPFKLRGRLR